MMFSLSSRCTGTGLAQGDMILCHDSSEPTGLHITAEVQLWPVVLSIRQAGQFVIPFKVLSISQVSAGHRTPRCREGEIVSAALCWPQAWLGGGQVRHGSPLGPTESCMGLAPMEQEPQ